RYGVPFCPRGVPPWALPSWRTQDGTNPYPGNKLRQRALAFGSNFHHPCPPPRSCSADFRVVLAWPNTAMPDWFKIWLLVISVVSSARSASRMREFAAERFSFETMMLLITDWSRFC